MMVTGNDTFQYWREENGVEIGAGFFRSAARGVTILDPNTQRLWDNFLFTQKDGRIEVKDVIRDNPFPFDYVGEPRFVKKGGVALTLANGAEITLGTQDAKYPVIRAAGDTSSVVYKGDLYAAVDGELTLKDIDGHVNLLGDGTLTVGTIKGYAYSDGNSNLTVETVTRNAYSYSNSTLTVGTIKGYAYSDGSSTLKAETVEGYAYSNGDSTLTAVTVNREAISYDTSTLRVETNKDAAVIRELK